MPTVWFARRATQNINANDGSTWNDKADGTGNWLTWASLGATDVLCANGNASLTINVSLTCARISTAAEVGSSDTGAAGGGFLVSGSSALTITANVQAGTTVCVSSTHTGTGANKVTIVGNCTGGSATNSFGYYHNAAGAVAVTGNCTGGAGANAHGFDNNATGAVALTGNCTGGAGSGAYGFLNMSTGTITVTGTCTGGPHAYSSGFLNNAGGGVTITGDVVGSSTTTAPGLYNSAAGVVTVTGNLVHTLKASAVYGGFRYTPAATNYVRHPYDATNHHNYALPLTAANIKLGVTGGYDDSDAAIVGTYGGVIVID